MKKPNPMPDINDAKNSLDQAFAPFLASYAESKAALDAADGIIRYLQRTIIHIMQNNRFSEPFIREVYEGRVEYIYDDVKGPSTRIRIIDSSQAGGPNCEDQGQYELRTGIPVFAPYPLEPDYEDYP